MHGCMCPFMNIRNWHFIEHSDSTLQSNMIELEWGTSFYLCIFVSYLCFMSEPRVGSDLRYFCFCYQNSALILATLWLWGYPQCVWYGLQKHRSSYLYSSGKWLWWTRYHVCSKPEKDFKAGMNYFTRFLWIRIFEFSSVLYLWSFSSIYLL